MDGVPRLQWNKYSCVLNSYTNDFYAAFYFFPKEKVKLKILLFMNIQYLILISKWMKFKIQNSRNVDLYWVNAEKSFKKGYNGKINIICYVVDLNNLSSY